MILLVDIGNTRLKWAQWQCGELCGIGAMLHGSGDIKTELRKTWATWPEPKILRLACVSSPAIKQLLIELVQQLWPKVVIQEVRSEQYAKGLTNAYAAPEKLGVDRWFAMIGAFHYYAAPFCLVDCGTAITLDVVDASGQHLGGMIMPGLTLMKQALSKGTADLGVCAQAHPQGLAKYTEAAIYNGNLAAVRGFIEAGKVEYGYSVPLILTGGDAVFVASALALDAIVDSDLVFKGLTVIEE